MPKVYFLIKRGHWAAIRRYLASPLGQRHAGTVIPRTYERLLSRMTKAYWWQTTKERWWETVENRWALPRVEPLQAVKMLAGALSRVALAPRRPPRGGYVFADLELLSGPEARRAAVLWHALAESGPGVRVLNHPTRSMRRYELLRNLYERGINTFNVYRVTEGRWPERYPVFVRGENDHGGSCTPLLHSRQELDDALATLDRNGTGRDGMLITEFCDTIGDDGVYRKYGAFMVGGHVFPKNVHFSKRWVLKLPDLAEEDMLREEREFVDTNPHERELREIFRLARIDYGRADYGVLNGRVQLWEINTNPHITSPTRGPRRPIYEHVEGRMSCALDEIIGRGGVTP